MEPMYFSRDDSCWYLGERRVRKGARLLISLIGGEVEAVITRSHFSGDRWWLEIKANFEQGVGVLNVVPADGMMAELIEERR